MGPLRCVVELDIQRVAAPGVWLPRRGDVYLSVTMFGQTGRTRLVDSIFPVCFYENFRFEKSYYTAVDTKDVELFLEDEVIEVELVQVSEYGTSEVRLASITLPALELLYPYRTIWPTYTSGLRELLLIDKSVAYPLSGLSPRVEFTSTSTIREDMFVDTLDVLEVSRRARSRSRSRSLTRPLSLTRRPRSLSRSRSLTRLRSRSPSPLRSCLRKSRIDTYYSDAEADRLTSTYVPVRPRSVSPYRSYLRSSVLAPLSTTSYRYNYPSTLYRSFDDLHISTPRSSVYWDTYRRYPSYLY